MPDAPVTFTSPAEALRAAVGRLGSQMAFARFVGVAQPSVWRWLKKGQPLPGEHVLRVEAETGISRYELNPEVFGTAPDSPPPHDARDLGAMAPAR